MSNESMEYQWMNNYLVMYIEKDVTHKIDNEKII